MQVVKYELMYEFSVLTLSSDDISSSDDDFIDASTVVSYSMFDSVSIDKSFTESFPSSSVVVSSSHMSQARPHFLHSMIVIFFHKIFHLVE